MMNENDEAVGGADWSELHGDLLDEILRKVSCCLSLSDYIRFGGVCSNWRSIQIRNHNDDDKRGNREMIKFHGQIPVLLIPYPSATHSLTTALGDDDGVKRFYSPQDNDDDDDDDDDDDEVQKFCEDRFYDPKDIWLGLDHTRLEKPTRTIYSLYDGKVHNDDIQLPVPYFLDVRGTSHGWLVAVREDEDFTVRLMNPFRSVNNEIQLPPLTSTLYFRDEPPRELIDSGYKFVNGYHFLVKAVVSANPSSVTNPSDLVVLLLYNNNKTALCRPGDASWTALPTSDHLFSDAIFYKGQFYAITYRGVMAIDATSFHRDDHPHPKLSKIASPPGFLQVMNRPSNKLYIVECAGELLQVRRHFVRDPKDRGFQKTIDLRVLKLDPSLPEFDKWVEIHTLGGHTLFLGGNASMSLLPPPDDHACKPNCIYFTDDYESFAMCFPSFGPHDMGVFNLEDGSFEPHYQMESKTIMPNAIWIQPML